MKPAPFSFQMPSSIDEAVNLLNEFGDDAKVLAGGQSLGPLLNMRLALPEAVVDVTKITELHEYEQSSQEYIFGAGITHSQFEDELVFDPTRGLLTSTAGGIGYRAIRNRGTLGGSLCHADASAEWPIVMAALNAKLVARSAGGTRTIPAERFVRGFFTNDLRDDELLTEVRIPKFGQNKRWGLQKTARKPGEFAESLAVVVLTTTANGQIEAAEAWLGAASDVPVAIEELESLLRGRSVEEVERTDVLQMVADKLGAGSNIEDRYYAHMHGTTMWRALSNTKESL